MRKSMQLYSIVIGSLLLASCLSSSSASVVSSQSSLDTSLISSESSSSTSPSSESSNESSEVSSSTSSESSVESSSSSEVVSSSISSEPQYDYEGYYASLNGKSDAQVFLTLRPLLRQALTTDGTYLNERLPKTYGEARYILDETDRDPNNSNNLILVYRQTSVPHVWDSGSTWNREHVWPQSLLAPGLSTDNGDRHKGADLQNLKPANPAENTSRGNKYYGTATTPKTYLPPANVRGDLARILFYMTTMYPELTLVNVNDGADLVTYQMAQLNLLVQWHLQDPVDAFELNRNNIIYSYQFNRNPYIDHEELVCRVWQNATPTIQSLCA
jgi:endonuclease I